MENIYGCHFLEFFKKTPLAYIILIILEAFLLFDSHDDIGNNNQVIKTESHHYSLNNLHGTK